MATDVDIGAHLHLPAGTVTFLLTDIDGSTSLWEAEPTEMAASVARHYEIIDAVVAAAGGVRPVEQGDGESAVAAFGRPSDAIAAAAAMQQALHVEPWPTSQPLRVRVAIHTGEARLRNAGNYMGEAIIRTARLRAVAHGGQVLVSAPAHAVAVDRVGTQFAFRDLGVHRLKDLARPEHVFQLCGPGLEEDFPELRSLDRHLNNLPMQLSPFIGRADEITTVAKLLAQHRLVTLCGSGGVGKTRLAQQVAAEEIEQYPDGVWWAELAELTEPASVGPTLAQVMGLADRADSDVWEALARLIGDRSMLVVLDNCEHVVEEVATGVDRLLRACAGLTVLATSRASLDVPGELTWRVPPLRLPDEHERVTLDALAQSDAMSLFADRAARARPNFRLTNDNSGAIAAICRRLDGVALAIELAAARIRSFTPNQILAGLDDALRTLTGGSRSVLPRQQTLEASVRWSHALLGDFERVLLRRLAVFRGGFSLDAVEAVVADELLPVGEILDRLDHLVDQSLVVADDDASGRYRLLETVRQFAARQLLDAGEIDELRDRHARFFSNLVHELGPLVLTNRMVDAVEALRNDLDNLRAALLWLDTQQRAVELTEMVAEAGLFWTVAGLVRDGETWLTHCLANDSCPEATRARLYAARASVRHDAGLFAASVADSARAIELGRQFEDWRSATLGYYEQIFCIGWADLPVTRTLMADAADCARRADDEALEARIAVLDAHSRLYSEGVQSARPRIDTIRPGVLRLGVPLVAVEFWYVDANCALFESDFIRALECAHECERLARHTGLSRWIGMATTVEELTRRFLGEHESALARLPASIDEMTRLGDIEGALFLSWVLSLHLLNEDIDRAESDTRELVAFLESAEVNFLLPWMFVVLAAIAQTRGQLEETSQLIARGRAVQQRVGLLHAGAMLEQRSASLERCRGEINQAEQTVHRALDMQHPNGYRAEVVVSLEILVGVLVSSRRMTDAARIAGAAQAERDRLGFRLRMPPEREIYAADLATLEQALGPDAFADAFAMGAAMSLDEAVAFAQRTRGRRGRPSHGWDSLTPTEQDVVRLIVDGVTNVEIAQRLLMGRETVKTHLSHIYTKLHVRTRAQLAALAATRAAEQR
ncbi:MAG TPA: LuxR C-terminal-related transcriptional regulator [Acidimicrobiales bacterium]|nr:LuxR C-terminal-related transcriptional regulator [Acidimicrobiales bacterium]